MVHPVYDVCPTFNWIVWKLAYIASIILTYVAPRRTSKVVWFHFNFM